MKQIKEFKVSPNKPADYDKFNLASKSPRLYTQQSANQNANNYSYLPAQSPLNKTLGGYNKFDCKTDIICHKRAHDNSRIAYICLEPQCKSNKRLGCAHCFLEDHQSHKKMKIDELQQKWSELCEQSIYLNYSAKSLYAKVQGQNINIVEKINSECNELKRWFSKMVDVARDSWIEGFDKELLKFNQKKEQQIDSIIKLKDYESSKRNIFEMTKEEIQQIVNIIVQKEQKPNLEQQDVEQFIANSTQSNFLKSYSKEIYQFCDQTIFKIRNSIHQILNDSMAIQTPSIEQIVQQEKLNSAGKIMSDQGFSNMKIEDGLKNPETQGNPVDHGTKLPEYTTKSILKSRPEPDSNQANLAQFDSASYIHSNFQANAGQRAPEQIPAELSKEDKEEKEKEFLIELRQKFIQKLETMQIYRQGCSHVPKSSLLILFECCNNCYPCSKCHDSLETHQRKITFPCKRFCIKCLEFFIAQCSQDIHVYCPECEAKQNQ